MGAKCACNGDSKTASKRGEGRQEARFDDVAALARLSSRVCGWVPKLAGWLLKVVVVK
jgi:hypothetical protein